MQLPPDTIMREMAKLAMEQATTFFARMADEFAENLPPDASGKMALKAFANTIRSSNAKFYPPKGGA